MAIILPTPLRKAQIDLDGPSGNVFVLLNQVERTCKQLKDIDPKYDSVKIIEEMKQSDYNNAVKVFDKYFGEYFDLVTTNKALLS